MCWRLKRVTVCALPLAAAMLGFGLTANAAQQSQMRYAEMDANRDGVISFREWRGTRAAFDAADWNGDGVLSGNEVWTQGGPTATRQPGDFDLTIDDRNDANARFESLDTNHNGWIERREWNGTYAGFNALDRNGDNVLTRGEMGIRGGAVGTSGVATRGRFEEMDANDDGVVSVREWFGTRAGFNGVDTNRDGVITRREYRLSQSNENSQVGRRRNPVNNQIVRVDSRQQWMATGIYVEPGDIVTFDADGSVTLSTNSNDMASPEGARSGRRADNAPIRDERAGAVIGRIGNSSPFMIGAMKLMRANETGELYLGVNDDFMQDNNGVFSVRISVR